ncbi:DUF1905 domain-containing protein [Lysobacter korlensis]|uniref:DUF1905 domain-containing protein n=1 Tax=Lysobacter korlensis TaxID=553636 RepID=A0ABV6RMB6_9GAMM
MQEFTTTLLERDNGVVYAVVPFDPREVWGKRVRHYIAGTLNDQPYEGSLGTRGGVWFFPINKAARERIGLRAGDDVRVRIEPRDKPGESGD